MSDRSGGENPDQESRGETHDQRSPEEPAQAVDGPATPEPVKKPVEQPVAAASSGTPAGKTVTVMRNQTTVTEPTARTRRWPGVRESVRTVNRALFGVGHRRLLVAGTVMLATPTILIGAMSGYGMWATSQPAFCSSCHVMEPYVRAWDSSPHRNVNCEKCHIPPGAAAFVGGKIAGLQVVINYWTGNYEQDRSFNAVVGNAACLRCHEEQVLGGTVTGEDGLRVSHRGIVTQGGKCITCHSTVAHESAMKVGARTYPQMQTCFRCHDGATASAGCTTCHEPRKNTRPGAPGTAATTP